MAGLLGDVLPYVYSRGNALQRMLGGLLSDPIGTAQQAGGLLQDQHRAQENLLAQAFQNQQRPFQVTDSNALQQASMNMLAGPLGFAPAGIMAGVGAKTANKAALAQAQAMEKQGVAPEAIWQQTGWGKGPDGLWRFEIDDSASAIKPKFAGSQDMRQSLIDAYKQGGRLQTVPDVLQHKPLSAAYPDVNKISVTPGRGGGAGFFPEEQRMVLGEITAPQGREAMLHELQHRVQDAEGFSKGGSPEQFNLRALYPGMRMDPESYLHQEQMKLSAQLNPLRDKLMEQYKAKQITGTQLREALSAEAKRIGYQDVADTLWRARNPVKAYEQLGGEAEARLVQSRMDMTPQQRAAQFPWNPDYFQEATGVPLNSLILR